MSLFSCPCGREGERTRWLTVVKESGPPKLYRKKKEKARGLIVPVADQSRPPATFRAA